MSNPTSTIAKALAARQAAEVEARSVAEQLDDLVVVPDLMHAFARQIDVAQRWHNVIDAYSADAECEHGALPTDPHPECDCWAGA